MADPFANAETPLIAVPIMARTLVAVTAQVPAALASDCDVVEWRVDGLTLTPGDVTAARALAAEIQAAGKWLLVTLRTVGQGGQAEPADYAGAVRGWADLLQPDGVDVEWGPDAAALTASLPLPVVLSWHDFVGTPSMADLQARMRDMAVIRPALVKLALMPHTSADVLTICALSEWARTNLPRPHAVMGMGPLGRITRVTGGLFGSRLTFATAGVSSAPGQLPVGQVRELLNLFKLDNA